MSAEAASRLEHLGLGELLEELVGRVRAAWPGWVGELPECGELELARRVVAAVAADEGSELVPDPLYVAEKAVAALGSTDDPSRLVHEDSRFESPLAARLLIRRARARASRQARDAIETATLAVRAAERVSRHVWGREHSRAMVLRARCVRVEALRTAGRLEEAWSEARELLEGAEPGLPPRLRGDLFLLAGQVRRDQGKSREAAALLFSAREVYESAEDEPRLGRTLLQLAEVYREHGQVDLAVEAARRAVSLLDPARDREAYVAARHNLAIYLCDLGRPVEARVELEASRMARGEGPQSEVRLGSLWVEGRIHELIGDSETAERLYREAWEGFEDLERPGQAALVSLDLAWILAEQRRYRECLRVATWLGLLCREHEVPAEVVAALVAFREAVAVARPDGAQVFGSLAELRTLVRRASPALR